MSRLRLSGRALHWGLGVARTLADMVGTDRVERSQLLGPKAWRRLTPTQPDIMNR